MNDSPCLDLNKNNKKIYPKIKTSLDILISLFLVVILIPLFIVIALLIKFSSGGPIFFLQERTGKFKKPFYCIKFRTMNMFSKDILEKLFSENKDLEIEFKQKHKLRFDPRITPFGKFLRKTGLDELPQLFNIIKMDMSLIGPRPIVQDEVYNYGNNIAKVFSIRPGISGLWQVSGRNKLTYKRRVELDLIYVDNYSFLMDLKIILRTFGVIFFPKDHNDFY